MKSPTNSKNYYKKIVNENIYIILTQVMRKKPHNINGMHISPQKAEIFNGNNIIYNQYYQYNNTYFQSKTKLSFYFQENIIIFQWKIILN